MSLWSEYVQYLKDNPERYWFKRKLFGWGWTPVTKEGWFVTLLAIAAIVVLGLRLDEQATDQEALRELILPTFAIILLLILICFKTGEPPKWTWGIPKNKEKKDQERGDTKDNIHE